MRRIKRFRFLNSVIFEKCARITIKAKRSRRFKNSWSHLKKCGHRSKLAAAENPDFEQPEFSFEDITKEVQRVQMEMTPAINEVEDFIQQRRRFEEITHPKAKEIISSLHRVKSSNLTQWNDRKVNALKDLIAQISSGQKSVEQLTPDERQLYDDWKALHNVLQFSLVRKLARSRDFGKAADTAKKLFAIAKDQPVELTEEDFVDIKSALPDIRGELPIAWSEQPTGETQTTTVTPEEKQTLYTVFSSMSPLSKLAVFAGVPLTIAGLLQAASTGGGTLLTGTGALLLALGVIGVENIFGSKKKTTTPAVNP